MSCSTLPRNCKANRRELEVQPGNLKEVSFSRFSPMNIAFFGSSLVSAYWNGAATYYRGIIRALHQRGHQITFYEPDAFDRQKHRDLPDPAWATVVVYSSKGTD